MDIRGRKGGRKVKETKEAKDEEPHMTEIPSCTAFTGIRADELGRSIYHQGEMALPLFTIVLRNACLLCVAWYGTYKYKEQKEKKKKLR
jgi:hypothetical protein